MYRSGTTMKGNEAPLPDPGPCPKVTVARQRECSKARHAFYINGSPQQTTKQTTLPSHLHPTILSKLSTTSNLQPPRLFRTNGKHRAATSQHNIKISRGAGWRCRGAPQSVARHPSGPAAVRPLGSRSTRGRYADCVLHRDV